MIFKSILCALLAFAYPTLIATTNDPAQTSVVKSFDDIAAGKKPALVFGALVKGNKPVVIKFFMPGCGACMATIEPFEQLAKKYPQADFVTIDITKYNLGKQFDIQTVPTFFIFNNGKKVAKFKRGYLMEIVEKALKK